MLGAPHRCEVVLWGFDLVASGVVVDGAQPDIPYTPHLCAAESSEMEDLLLSACSLESMST